MDWALLALGLLNLAGLVVVLRKVGAGFEERSRAIGEELRLHREEAQRTHRSLRDELQQRFDAFRHSSEGASRHLREEVATTLKMNADGIGQQLLGFSKTLQGGIESLTRAVDGRLKDIQHGNTQSLDTIRRTVDEQLQTALERRLTESFKVVSDNLASVQKGLGEMQSLANGVGDLKRVLTNVKARGTWAEYQLGAILEEMLTAQQYAKNVQVRSDGTERVEFAVKLPGQQGAGDAAIWLPIDSKFPQDLYQRLLNAVDSADPVEVTAAAAELARGVETCAKEICEKYIHPPYTTDFAILFVPTEGLFAEILRMPGLSGTLQNKFRVMVAGPTTLAAVLNSLRVGFQTLAIERRASEVWTLLRAIKTEFNTFDQLLIKLKRQLDRAAKTIDATDTRTRVMRRKLHEVESLPAAGASEVLSLPEIEVLEPPENYDEDR